MSGHIEGQNALRAFKVFDFRTCVLRFRVFFQFNLKVAPPNSQRMTNKVSGKSSDFSCFHIRSLGFIPLKNLAPFPLFCLQLMFSVLVFFCLYVCFLFDVIREFHSLSPRGQVDFCRFFLGDDEEWRHLVLEFGDENWLEAQIYFKFWTEIWNVQDRLFQNIKCPLILPWSFPWEIWKIPNIQNTIPKHVLFADTTLVTKVRSWWLLF